MSLRISSKAELIALVAKGMLPKEAVVNYQKSLGTSKATRMGCSTGAGVLCPLVPVQPADILYQAICRRFGRFYEGGLAVYELEFTFEQRKFRADIGLPEFKLIVELDGWQYHGKTLSGFKRDREKSLVFERRGWSVIRFSNEQIRTNIQDVLLALQEVMSHRVRQPELRSRIALISFSRSRYEGAA